MITVAKTCARCGEAKPLAAFSTKNGKPVARCKACRCAIEMQRYHSKRDYIRAKQAEWRASNQDYVKAKRQEYCAPRRELLASKAQACREVRGHIYNANRRARIAARRSGGMMRARRRLPTAERVAREAIRNAHWYARNAERAKAEAKRWRDENRELSRHHVKERRARKLALGRCERLPLPVWQARLEEFGYRCAYCAILTKLSQDHVTPLVDGGAHEIENVVPACRSCNSSKSDRSLIVWLARKRRAA